MPQIPTLPGELAFYCGAYVTDEKTNAEGVTGTHLRPHSQSQRHRGLEPGSLVLGSALNTLKCGLLTHVPAQVLPSWGLSRGPHSAEQLT